MIRATLFLWMMSLEWPGAWMKRWSMLGLLLLPALAFVAADPDPPDAPDASDTACGDAPPAWFLGVAHDDALRDDFQEDVDHFEYFLERLRQNHCIPDDQAQILAFWDDYTRNGKTYDAATEQNAKDTLAAFGAAASQEPEATLFYFHSSHGMAYGAVAPPGCDGAIRPVGSYANLRNGNMYDCELGRALNDGFADHVRMAIFVDCSFCGGFSDSLTAASGTLDDDGVLPSGVVAPDRIVFTGCAITTECFGGSDGAVSYGHMRWILEGSISDMDGWTVPGFPLVYGVNAPAPIGTTDGRATVSEWVFRSVWDTYNDLDAIGIQQQYRLKYGMDSLQEDIRVL